MVSNFSESLHYEVKEWIDVTCWEAGGVDTTIFNNGIDGGANPPPRWTMLSAERAVGGVLSQLGRARSTNGNYWFNITGWSMYLIPLKTFGTQIAKKGREKYLRYAPAPQVNASTKASAKSNQVSNSAELLNPADKSE